MTKRLLNSVAVSALALSTAVSGIPYGGSYLGTGFALAQDAGVQQDEPIITDEQADQPDQPVKKKKMSAEETKKAIKKAVKNQKQAEKAEEAAKKAEKAARKAERAEQKAADQEARQAEQEAKRQAAEAEKQAEQARKAAEQQSEEARKAAEQEQLKTEQAAEQEQTRKTKKERKQGSETQQAEQPSETTGESVSEAPSEPAAVSKQAAKPKRVAEEPIDQKLEKAEEEQTAVVSEDISTEQRKRIDRAEKKRREKARDNRGELLGAAAIGAVVGALIPALGGRVVADEGDRIIVERDGRYYVRKDENALFRGRDTTIETERMRNGNTREIISRPNGVQVITVRDPGGYILRREKILANGQRYVLFDARDDESHRRRVELPRYRIDIPRDRYAVSARRADRELFRETFMADPVYISDQRYTLRQVRENVELRDTVRRVDLDTINFATGSAYVTDSQVRLLGDVAGAMLDVIDSDPSVVFLIEGHTDAVGSELYNLDLSDRRAESVARILIDYYDVPPENLTMQGYGEQYLKVDTLGPSWENRRATIRNISPLLETSMAR